ncbi:MAG: hypothetical protein AAFQ42_09610 [Pseudomonadota bacterium]
MLVLLARFADRLFHHARTAAGRIGARAQLRQSVAQERAALARLDRRLLADIGVRPEDAQREARRGRFDLPSTRVDVALAEEAAADAVTRAPAAQFDTAAPTASVETRSSWHAGHTSHRVADQELTQRACAA